MPTRIPRRDFLVGGAAAAGLFSGCSLPQASAVHEVPASTAIPAIDVHGHYGPSRGRQTLSDDIGMDTAAAVRDLAFQANIRWTVCSPLRALLPRGEADPVQGNQDAAADVPNTPGLLQYVVVDPLKPETYEQGAEMLKQPHAPGIKIHPEEHIYPIKEHGRKLFEFAAQHTKVILSHSGEEKSLPADLLALANDFPQLTVILAHLGHSANTDTKLQVRAIQASKHGNVYVDTSSSKSIRTGLIEMAVREVGSEKILFGTDTPLYFAPMQRARIDYADISHADKENILWNNSVRIFGLTKEWIQ